MILVRSADDIVVGFEHEADAQHFREAMHERLQEFALSRHPDKTRLIEFGRRAAASRARAWQAGDLRVPGLYLHLWQDAPRALPDPSPDPSEDPPRPHADEAPGDQGGAATADAPAHSPAGAVAEAGRHRLLPPTMPWRPTVVPWRRSATPSSPSGDARCGDAARRTARRGTGSLQSPTTGSRSRAFFTPGRSSALPSDTQGGSRMPEWDPSGSVRGALSNERPYRDSVWWTGSGLQSLRHVGSPFVVDREKIAPDRELASPPGPGSSCAARAVG